MFVKPGLLTSELWLVVAAVAQAETQALSSNQTINLASLGLAALYAVCRTLLKTQKPSGSSSLQARIEAVAVKAAAGAAGAVVASAPQIPPPQA